MKEFGEGVDRVFTDMEHAGLPDPVYQQNGFMLYAELRNKNWGRVDMTWVVTTQDRTQGTTQDRTQASEHNVEINQKKLILFCRTPRTRAEMMDYLGLKNRKRFAENYMEPLLAEGKIFMTVPDKPSSPKQKYYSKFDH